MYMDGMVLRGHPEVDLISSMGPYLDEFASIVELPYTADAKGPHTAKSAFWESNPNPSD